MSASNCSARLRIEATRTSPSSGADSAQQPAAEEDALAQPGAGDLDAVEAAVLEHRLEHDRGGEHDVGAARLDAGQRALRRRALGQLGHELAQRGAPEHVALDAVAGRALGRGGEVADGAAHADEPAAGAGEPAFARELLADGGARRLELLARRGARGGEELLGHAHGAERPRRGALRAAARDRRELEAAAAEVEHHAVARASWS